MRRKVLMIVVALHFASNPVHSGSDPIINETIDNISNEYIDCAGYYSIVSKALKISGEKEASEKYEQISEEAAERALIVANQTRSKDMAEKVTLARYELSMKGMLDDIDNDISNISILSNEYAYRCKEAMEDPEAMTKRWGEKILNKRIAK